MAKVQVWFSVVRDPKISEEQKNEIRKKASWVEHNNLHGGRILVHALVEQSEIEQLKELLNSINKSVKICDVRHCNGVRFGQKKVLTGVDENGSHIYETQNVLDESGEPIPKHAIDEVERANYFGQQSYKDENNTTQSYVPPDHQFAGWESWENRI